MALRRRAPASQPPWPDRAQGRLCTGITTARMSGISTGMRTPRTPRTARPGPDTLQHPGAQSQASSALRTATQITQQPRWDKRRRMEAAGTTGGRRARTPSSRASAVSDARGAWTASVPSRARRSTSSQRRSQALPLESQLRMLATHGKPFGTRIPQRRDIRLPRLRQPRRAPRSRTPTSRVRLPRAGRE